MRTYVRIDMAGFTEKDARRAIGDSLSWAEALRRLGYCQTGGNWKTLKKYAAVWEISTAHFDPDFVRNRALRRSHSITPLEEILVEGSTYSRSHLKRRLFEVGLKERFCELCGQGEIWQGRRMALILDHANGVRNDHRLANLRIVCPNCAATLDTHCGRKNGSTPLPSTRDCLHCGKAFAPRYQRHRYCSRSCGSRWDRSHLRGVPKPATRRVERPPYRQLVSEIEATGYAAVGRKYGVSDNAVRKWVRQYDRERAARAMQ
jgi:hypothetical protein